MSVIDIRHLESKISSRNTCISFLSLLSLHLATSLVCESRGCCYRPCQGFKMWLKEPQISQVKIPRGTPTPPIKSMNVTWELQTSVSKRQAELLVDVIVPIGLFGYFQETCEFQTLEDILYSHNCSYAWIQAVSGKKKINK